MTEAELDRIKNFVNDRRRYIKDPQHGFSHLLRVADFSQKIVKILSVRDKIDLNLLLGVCFLHDINHTYYSPGFINYFFEKIRLKKVLPEILIKLNINSEEKKIMEKAIYSSPFSFPFKILNPRGDLYTKILQDADTLDFFQKKGKKAWVSGKIKVFFISLLGFSPNVHLPMAEKTYPNI